MSAMMAEDGPQPLCWGRKEYKHPGLYLGSGNRCGHDPQRLASDRLALKPVKNDQRLKMITHLVEKAQTYFADPASVPLLAYLKKKKNKDGSYRQNRSEGREAQALILSAILSVTDLASLRVGRPLRNGSFRNYTFDEIAAMCGLVEPSEDATQPPVACSRFRRGVDWLKKAGAIKVFEQYEETAEGKRGRPAIKTVSAKFIMTLGKVSKLALDRVRKKASDKLAQWRNEAIEGGIQTQDEYDQVSAALLSERTKASLFPGKPRKNQAPKTVAPDNGLDQLGNDWEAYQAMMKEKIRERNGGELPQGFRAYGTAYVAAGGLNEREWRLRRALS